MKTFRTIFAIVLAGHGLAHASAGMWATDIGGRALVTFLWEGATLGFIAAAAGLLGVPFLARRWRALVIAGASSSLVLLLLYSHPLFAVGIAADLALVAIALAPAIGGQLAGYAPPGRITQTLLIALLLYTGTAIALRPWHSSWGTTRSEQMMVMASDPPLGESHYRIDHALTIHAPVDSVWPWLAQISKGRRVREIRDGRAIVLGNWRAFVLEPVGAKATRLHIRTRGAGVPTLSGIAVTPVSLLVIEPAHFIMERGMMLGIKRRAERDGLSGA